MGVCIFCGIIDGRLDAYKVYEDDDVLVILDKYPATKGHLLVLTKRHYESVHDADYRDVAKAFVVAGALARIYRVKVGAPGVKIVANSGRPAGQEVFHLHIHVIPYWPGPKRIPRRVIDADEAQEVISTLKPHIDDIRRALEESGFS